MPKRNKKKLDETTNAYRKNPGAAARSPDAVRRYTGAVGPVLAAQNSCSDETLRTGKQGYAALAAYASCMATRGRDAIAGGAGV